MKKCPVKGCTSTMFDGDRYCLSHQISRPCSVKGCTSTMFDGDRYCLSHQLQFEVWGLSKPLLVPVSSITPQGSDCWLYLIDRSEQQKIGITTNPDRRLNKEHRSNDWKLVELRGPIDLKHAQYIEYSILRELDRIAVRRGSDIWEEYFDGYSETWSKTELHVRRISELLPRHIAESDYS